jgi:hypothetical protein
MQEPSVIVKPSRRKYIIAAIIALLIITALVFIWFNREQKPDPDSEAIIRRLAAEQLHKDPNDLTNEDFAKITKFTLCNIVGTWPNSAVHYFDMCDIKLLEKFTNLQNLDISWIQYPDYKIPKWMKFLSKLGIVNLGERYSIDLSPIKNLSRLEILSIQNARINSIEPLAGLVNLKELTIFQSGCDLEPIKALKNLRWLHLINCDDATKEKRAELQKALPNMEIVGWDYIKWNPNK